MLPGPPSPPASAPSDDDKRSRSSSPLTTATTTTLLGTRVRLSFNPFSLTHHPQPPQQPQQPQQPVIIGQQAWWKGFEERWRSEDSAEQARCREELKQWAFADRWADH